MTAVQSPLTSFLKLPHKARQWVGHWKRSLLKQGVACNVCNWCGPAFESDSWHPNTICPVCGSQVRHRLLVAALSNRPELSFRRLVDGKKILHFAAEPALRQLLASRAARHYAVEYMALHVYKLDARLDLQTIAFASQSVDLVLACDVMEHIPDDRSALQEIRRVLKPNGWAILTVPQKDTLAHTFEDPTITSPSERERVFGQFDHMRLYGADFPHLVAEAGFRVTTVQHTDFSPRQVRYYTLFPTILSTHPLATNYRKVFFAQRI